MNLLKKIAIGLFWCTFAGSVIFLMGFINRKNGELKLRSIDITISRPENIMLLAEEDVMGLIGNSGQGLLDKPFSELDLEALEWKINQNPYVVRANVYSTLPGNLYIDLLQRIPLARVINQRNEPFYISTDGHLMALHPDVIIPAMVASGMIDDSLDQSVILRNYDALQTNPARPASALEMIYNLAAHIKNNHFLRAQIEQIYINDNQEIELIPKVGRHLIVFGGLDNMESKFRRLEAFYSEGVRYSGWELYSVINLKYDKQIVCTK